MRFTRSAAMLAPLTIAAAVTLTACGSSGAPTANGPSSVTTPSHASNPSNASSPAAGSSACGTPPDAVRKSLPAMIKDVTFEGQCTVVISTTLADDNHDVAVQICDAATKIAYTGDINSIRVTSASGAELAKGMKGAQCQP